MEFKPGDIVRLKRRHPCGNYDWKVIRVGSDIGIKCQKCQRYVLLQRRVFEHRIKSISHS